MKEEGRGKERKGEGRKRRDRKGERERERRNVGIRKTTKEGKYSRYLLSSATE